MKRSQQARGASSEHLQAFVDVRQSQELFYRKEPSPVRQQQKEVNQIKLLQNQVLSLKEIIGIMEKEVVRNQAKDSAKQPSYQSILEKWRAKVFEQLVATKRYEIVIRDNLAAYNEEKASLKATIADLQSQLQLASSKVATLSAESIYRQQTIERVDAVSAAQRKELERVKEENAMMKHALKSLRQET